MPPRVVLLLLLAALLPFASAAVKWWEKGVVYELYPRSFQDSDGDGIGDIPGIISRLDYLVDLGVAGIWLHPIYNSPQKDFGYDVSDYRGVDTMFGTMADMDELILQLHNRGLKIIMDFVPNHSSIEHEWFKAASDPTNPDHDKYKDYYVWLDSKVPGERVPPNNWEGAWSPSAWEWVEANQQYYFHNFLVEQADLNYRNPVLVEEMKNVLRFWLDKGVDGFRMDVVGRMVEKEGFPDMKPGGPDPRQDQPETYEILEEFRAVLDSYVGRDLLMFVEAWGTVPVVMDYFGNSTNPGANFCINFLLFGNVTLSNTAAEYVTAIQDWNDELAARNFSNNWLIGNHDTHRVGSRYNEDVIDGFNMLVLLLPGTAITYYGEEIGMLDNDTLSCEISQDPQGCFDNVTLGNSRDPERLPMQWDDTLNAGFSTSDRTWLPVHTDYPNNNVALQNSLERSHLKTYKKVLRLRETEVFQLGSTTLKSYNTVLSFSRDLEGQNSIIVAFNTRDEIQTVNFRELFNLQAVHLMVVAQSLNSNLDEMAHLLPDSIVLNGYASVVFETMPDMRS